MEYELSKTKEFDKWMNYLNDPVTKARIARRIKNMKFGHFGDHKKISPDLFEIRFFFGSGVGIVFITPLKTTRLFFYFLVVISQPNKKI